MLPGTGEEGVAALGVLRIHRGNHGLRACGSGSFENQSEFTASERMGSVVYIPEPD